jgi:hypothetical protein
MGEGGRRGSERRKLQLQEPEQAGREKVQFKKGGKSEILVPTTWKSSRALNCTDQEYGGDVSGPVLMVE